MSHIELFAHKNGFRCIYQKSYSTIPMTSIQCFVKLGSIYENHENRGSSHFIEHMCFKGTRKIPNAKDISTVYDRIGAYFNAMTTKEFTNYIVNCNDEYVENCLTVLSDMIFNSTFKKENFMLERDVVIEEVVRDEDDPESKMDDMSDRLIYKGSPYENPIDDLSYHTESQFEYDGTIQTYKSYYIPANVCLSIVSNHSFKTIQRILSKTYFTNETYKNNSVIQTIKNPTLSACECQKGVRYDLQTKSGISANYLTITFRTCHYNHPDKYVLNVLSEILGGYMSSRMFQMLRDKHGITYKSTCYTTYYKMAGEIQLSSVCDPKNMLKTNGVFPLLMKLLRTICKKGVTKEEVDRAKGHIKGSLINNLQNGKNACYSNGVEYFIYDSPTLVPYDKIYDTHYASITKECVFEVIEKYFIKDNMSICILGDTIPSLDTIKEGVKIFE